MVSSLNYRSILPQSRSGILAINTVYLPFNVSARPYWVEDFHAGLEASEVLEGMTPIEPYSNNHDQHGHPEYPDCPTAPAPSYGASGGGQTLRVRP